jgi:hypothetical protein
MKAFCVFEQYDAVTPVLCGPTAMFSWMKRNGFVIDGGK